MFSGRIGRLAYFLGLVYLLIPLVVFIIVYAVLAKIGSDHHAYRAVINIVLSLLGFIWLAFLVPIVFGLTVRRIHDLNQSGWLSFLQLIPFISNVVSIFLLFVPGTKGRNKHGKPNRSRGFIPVLFGKN